jgi:hypothetical protein
MFLLHHGRRNVLFIFKFFDAFMKTAARKAIESINREGLIVGICFY